ncbi:hypothetical protein K9L97_02465 [Candidatus Woesearchaeota archaeon]|nr:hypothetical protein [Candidatus Woesearchaeota archaeon]
MKHTINVTLLFILMFFISNLLGLYLLNISMQSIENFNGTSKIVYSSTTIGDRAEVSGWESLVYIALGITIGTFILLYFVKRKKVNWWKTWFFIAAAVSMSVAFGTLFGPNFFLGSWILSFVLAYVKIFRFNSLVHNFTEIIMYAGIAVLFVPILNVQVMIVLLAFISLYDALAVWKSKHMVKMARFTSDASVFPGLSLQYDQDKKVSENLLLYKNKKTLKSSVKTGILGGGDVVFPLLFNGVLMSHLILLGILPSLAFLYSLIPIFVCSLALFGLFWFGKKNRFYPAMPFLSLGCLVGFFIVFFIV